MNSLLEKVKSIPPSSYFIGLVLLIAPIVSFYPITLLHYTFGRVHIVTPSDQPTFQAVRSWPVQDSYASAMQDEPWLVLIKNSLAHGSIPLVNLENGLGAPLVETMQAGVFYLANPLLLFLNTDKPLFFDLFILAHIYILEIGLFLLFRLYSRKEIALIGALLVALSGGTYINTNMVHFRSFVWLPFILLSTVLIARGQRQKLAYITLFFSILAAITAGSVQDFVISLGVTLVLFSLEYFLHQPKKNLERIFTFFSALISSCLVGSAAILPYFFSLAEKNLFADNGVNRALQSVDLLYMLTWIIPKIKGLFPFGVLSDITPQQNQPDFPTMGFFFVIVTLVIVFFWYQKKKEKVKTFLLVFLIAFSFLFWLKSMHIWLFDFIKYIPFVNSLKFAKYNLSLAVLLGIVGVSGLESFTHFSAKERHKLLLWSSLVMFIILVGICIYFVNNTNLDKNLLYNEKLEIALAWFSSIISLIVTAALLYIYPKKTFYYLALLSVVAVTVLQPFGYFKRDKDYQAIFPLTSMRKILSESKIENPRVLPQSVHTNQSLFVGFESIGVWDAILNNSYRSFLMEKFSLNTPQLILQPNFDTILTDKQVGSLRLLGVNYIEGYKVEPSSHLNKLGENIYQVSSPAPRVFLLDNSTPGSDDNKTTDKVLEQAESLPKVNVISIGNNQIKFTVDQSFSGKLVANQVFTTDWKFEGHKPEQFNKIFPMWSVNLKPKTTYIIYFWPTGLQVGLWLIPLGLGLFSAGWLILLRKKS